MATEISLSCHVVSWNSKEEPSHSLATIVHSALKFRLDSVPLPSYCTAIGHSTYFAHSSSTAFQEALLYSSAPLCLLLFSFSLPTPFPYTCPIHTSLFFPSILCPPMTSVQITNPQSKGDQTITTTTKSLTLP